MVRFGPKLEKRQAVLGRLVEIGAELLAIAAACSRAQAMLTKNPRGTGPRELADVFRWCNEGAHQEQPGGMLDQVRRAGKLADWLRRQP